MSFFNDLLDKAASSVTKAVTETSRAVGKAASDVARTIVDEAKALAKPAMKSAGGAIAKASNAVVAASRPIAGNITATARQAMGGAQAVSMAASSAGTAMAQTGAQAAGLVKAAADEICWSCIEEFIIQSSAELAVNAASLYLSKAKYVAARDSVQPYVTAGTARNVGLTAASTSTIFSVASKAFAYVSLIEPAVGWFYTAKYASEGNKEAASISASNASGATATSILSIAAGTATFSAVVALTAVTTPVWVPVVASIAVGGAVAIGTKMIWDNFAQDPATDAYRKLYNKL